MKIKEDDYFGDLDSDVFLYKDVDNDDIDVDNDIELSEDYDNIDDNIDDNNIDDDIDDDIVDDIVDDNFDIIRKLNNSKHNSDGKHALERDVILKGKIDDKEDDNNDVYNYSNSLEVGSLYEFEYKNNNEYINQKSLSLEMFELIDRKTDINYKQNRRKPNKIAFNSYYEMLISELNGKYTNYEIFVELSTYFTDNIFNCFKLLEKKHVMDIIKELKDRGFLKDLDTLNFV